MRGIIAGDATAVRRKLNIDDAGDFLSANIERKKEGERTMNGRLTLHQDHIFLDGTCHGEWDVNRERQREGLERKRKKEREHCRGRQRSAV